MGRCKVCNRTSDYISKEMAVCLKCIREKPKEAIPIAMDVHRRSRAAFRLPEKPPGVTQLLNFPLPLRHRERHLRIIREEFSEYAGRQTAPCMRDFFTCQTSHSLRNPWLKNAFKQQGKRGLKW